MYQLQRLVKAIVGRAGDAPVQCRCPSRSGLAAVANCAFDRSRGDQRLSEKGRRGRVDRRTVNHRSPRRRACALALAVAACASPGLHAAVASSADTDPAANGVSRSTVWPGAAAATAAATAIDRGELLEHVRRLASDEFDGRAPGTRGEARTVEYLTDEFRKLGLAPGNPDGTYVQAVPMAGTVSRPTGFVTTASRRIALGHRRDFVVLASERKPQVTVADSELVFVGYGVVAPEFGWDDYKGADVRGKTVVVLMNDPQVPDPRDGSKLDPALFGGPVRTAYSTSRHKREMAAARGAAAMITLHEVEVSGFRFDQLFAQAGRVDFELAADAADHLAVEALMPVESSRPLLKMLGQDFDTLKRRAVQRDFVPVPLNARVTFEVSNTLSEVVSHNVVARLAGSDPVLKDDVIVYTAHWDTFGRDDALAGHPIYPGAADNATGVGALLEIARAYARAPQRPRRSVLFIATTGEEHGLLGAGPAVAPPPNTQGRTR
jgi:hypothetical protein